MDKELREKIKKAVDDIIRQNGQFGEVDVMGLASEFGVSEFEIYDAIYDQE
jgi:hypothetical protein